ncbi:hypothetical protein CUMW_107940 [Citrus unshiu]|uniref:Uncharacterized protein n=2 Tax=Citrus TaxID=2706 RepID=A0A067EBA1_CITSI|nr:hypothetical protein CISIN_1g045395mg [Citrus sinensis]GAY47909.1 hypothetical protein CUMW_107940 [Citrus unshiu]
MRSNLCTLFSASLAQHGAVQINVEKIRDNQLPDMFSRFQSLTRLIQKLASFDLQSCYLELLCSLSNCPVVVSVLFCSVPTLIVVVTSLVFNLSVSVCSITRQLFSASLLVFEVLVLSY